MALDAIFARVMLSETRGLGSFEDGPPPPTRYLDDRTTREALVAQTRPGDDACVLRLCVLGDVGWRVDDRASIGLGTDLGPPQALGPGQIGALFAGQRVSRWWAPCRPLP